MRNPLFCSIALAIFVLIPWQMKGVTKEEVIQQIRELVPKKKLELSFLANALKDGIVNLEDLSQLRREGIDSINVCYEMNFYRKDSDSGSSGEEEGGDYFASDVESDSGKSSADSEYDVDSEAESTSFLEWLIQHQQSYQQVLWQVLRHPHTNLNYVNGFGQSPLMFSIIFDNPKVFRFLMRRKVLVNTVDTLYESTALHLAATSNKKEYVQCLLKAKANTKAQRQQDGLTPYALAVSIGAKESIAAFQDSKAKAFASNEIVNPALMAVLLDDLETFRSMVEKNPHQMMRQICIYLNAASQVRNSKILRYFLLIRPRPSRFPTLVESAFQSAIQARQVENIEALCEASPDLVNMPFRRGHTSLMLVNDIHVLRALLDLGADPQVKNYDGENALVYARNHGFPPESIFALSWAIAAQEPSVSTSKLDHDTEEESDEKDARECAICIDQSGYSSELFVTFPCEKHKFHAPCLAEWTADTCPLCRHHWASRAK